MCGAEHLQLCVGVAPLVEAFRAIGSRQPEQSGRVLLRALRQRQFRAVEVGLTDPPPLSARVGIIIIIGGGERRGRRHLAEKQEDHGRGPSRHVDLRDGLGEAAWKVAASVGDVEPQRRTSRSGVELARPAEIGKRLRQGAAVELRDAPVGVGGRGLGIETDRLVVVGDGGIVLALGAVGAAAVDVSGAELGIDPDRLIVVGDGALEIALSLVGAATGVVEGRKVEIDVKRLVVVRDGAVELPFVEVGEAAVGVGVGIIGIQTDGLAVIGDRALAVPLCGIRIATVVEGDGAIVRGIILVLDDARAGGNAASRVPGLNAIVPIVRAGGPRDTRDADEHEH